MLHALIHARDKQQDDDDPRYIAAKEMRGVIRCLLAGSAQRDIQPRALLSSQRGSIKMLASAICVQARDMPGRENMRDRRERLFAPRCCDARYASVIARYGVMLREREAYDRALQGLRAFDSAARASLFAAFFFAFCDTMAYLTTTGGGGGGMWAMEQGTVCVGCGVK